MVQGAAGKMCGCKWFLKN